MKNRWLEIKKELDERLDNAVPLDLKNYVGLIDAKGYCDLCRQKKLLFVDRNTKKSLCLDCNPIHGYEYTATEFNDMWQLVRDTLYYANEIILELMYPNLDFTPVTPNKIIAYITLLGWKPLPVGTNTIVRRFRKNWKNIDFDVYVPATTDLADYHRAVEIVIEVVSKIENQSQYELFKGICLIPETPQFKLEEPCHQCGYSGCSIRNGCDRDVLKKKDAS